MSPADQAAEPTQHEITDYLLQLSIAAVMVKLGAREITITREDLLQASDNFDISRQVGVFSGWTMKLVPKQPSEPSYGPYQLRAREIVSRLGLGDKP